MESYELVSGRLYTLKNTLQSSDYESNEDLAMFLRFCDKKVSVLTVGGDYKLVEPKELLVPEKDYMELFEEDTINKFTTIMKKFYEEYKKYNNIKYHKRDGFKSGKTILYRLNVLQKDLQDLKVLPILTMAIDNYFNVYKEMGVKFKPLEDLIVDFAYIPEWEENFTKLRGFDFTTKNISPRKIKKFSNEALMLHHIYTNLFINPNFKNIKAEWLDLLLDKLNKYTWTKNVGDEVIGTINLIKWKCIIENSYDDSSDSEESNSIDLTL